MTNHEVIHRLCEFANHTAIHVGDKDYALVGSGWFLGAGKRWVEGAFHALRTWSWARTFDCNNRAALARALYRLCHSQSGQRPEEGILVAEIHFYSRQLLGNHAVVGAFTERGWVWLELNSWSEITLSEDELQSCFFVYA